MVKQYLQQVWQLFRQQPVVAWITVAGTALSIFLIMLVVMMQQVKVAPFAPESNRDRFLHVRYASITNTAWGDGSSNGALSIQTGKELYGSLTTPETVTFYTIGVTTYPVNLPGQPSVAVDVCATDSAMAWRLGAALIPVRYCDLPRSRLLPYHSHQHRLSAPPTDKCSPAS